MRKLNHLTNDRIRKCAAKIQIKTIERFERQ